MGYPVRQKLPTKLSLPQWVDEFVRHVSEGATLKCAAGLMGVHPDTVSGWMMSGRDPENPCHQFFTKVMLANSSHEAKLIKRWNDIIETSTDFRAAQNMLAMRHNWSQPSTKVETSVTVTHTNDRPDLEGLSTEQLAAYLQAKETADRILLEAKQKVIECTAEEID